jgi:membrane fusion protein, multidrug efflux system
LRTKVNSQVFIIILIVFIACKDKKKENNLQQKPAAPPTTVDVMLATTQSVSGSFEANGSVIPNESVEIRPEISGRLTYLYLPEGARVSQGTILAKINDADLQAQLAKIKVQLALAEKTEARLKKLIDINGINQADYDAAVTQVNSLKADINVLLAQLEKTIIKAPFTGVLGLRIISPGAYITPQNSLATLQQVEKVKIDFSVPEDYGYLIKKGNSVSIQTNEGNQRRRAIIIATEPQINTTTRNIKVRALLDGSPINAGSFVKVNIATGGNSNNILVPSSAIIPDARAKKIIVVRGGKGVFVEVETGNRFAANVAITKGLQIGDSVVVTGVLFVRPNLPVKVRSVKKLEELGK